MGSLPEIFGVRQTFAGPELDEPAAEVARQLESTGWGKRIRPGQRVAITAGSRGIHDIVVILSAIVAWLQKLAAEPFIVPAMGSHGGGTADGQRQVLASLGITETAIGCPILASMETVVVGQAPQGFDVHLDRHASEADHVLVCGRVKPHTNFAGAYQSGIMKMMLPGLGKHEGAKVYHRAALEHNFDDLVLSVSRLLIQKTNILGGLAILENAYGRTAELVALQPEEIEVREPQLLITARAWMAHLPFEEVDILLVDEIGKHISGTGMDTNIVGRKFAGRAAAGDEQPVVRKIVVRSVVGGNATGIGLAEFCTTRALEQADMEATRINSITSQHPQAAVQPPDFPSDRQAIEAALRSIGVADANKSRILWIKNTSELEVMACSAGYWREAQQRSDLQILGNLRQLSFDEAGNLPAYVTDVYKDKR